MEWTTIDELLELFSVRASYSGTEWFCRLVEFNAMYAAFPDLGVGYGDIIRAELRRLRCSPLLYWGQQRRALRPLLEADALTLRALGLDVPDDFNCADIARAVSAVLAVTGKYNRSYAVELAPVFLRGKHE